MMQRMLAAQPDHSVSICITGFVSCLTQLLASEPDDLSPLTGVELVRKKVKCLYLMVIHAVEGDAEFLLSERGIVTLTPKNVTIFTPSATGNFRYQKPGSKAWYDEKLEIIRTYNRMK